LLSSVLWVSDLERYRVRGHSENPSGFCGP